jgi:proteasome accessory factor A
MPLFGIETEYGLAVSGKGASDLMAESRALVRSYSGKYAAPWDYASENPRMDMRGFEAAELAADAEDRRFDEGGPRYESPSDERSDRVLPNGARLYNDHGHPEYATPECRRLYDLIAHDRAGERIVFRCAQSRSASGPAVSVYKNNTDYHGASYGCHESYLFPRAIPFEDLAETLVPFLVTRQVFAGAGKVGVEGSGGEAAFQLSQRADHITETASVDTLSRRPILNTRDEPHADPSQWRRLHVICGDANMSEYATALKVGAAAAVLALVQEGWRSRLRLEDPVRAFRGISRDESRRWIVELEGGRTMGAVDIQRVFASQAAHILDDIPDDIRWVIGEWNRVLDILEDDWTRLSDRLDWVAKNRLLEEFREEEGLDWSDPALQSLDLAYSDINPDEGLFRGLEAENAVWCLVGEGDVGHAMAEPPPDTRAAVRGAVVTRFAQSVRSISWGAMALDDGTGTRVVETGPLVGPGCAALASSVLQAGTVREAVLALERGKAPGAAGQ